MNERKNKLELDKESILKLSEEKTLSDAEMDLVEGGSGESLWGASCIVQCKCEPNF